MRKKTHEEFVKEMTDKNPSVKIIGKYNGALTDVDCQCEKCNYIWKAKPEKLVRGTGCPKCFIERRKTKITRTHEEFVDIMSKINPQIQIIGTYVRNKVKVKSKCLICGHEWNTLPSNLLQGFGCPKCVSNKRKEDLLKSHEEFIEELKIKNPKIKVIGKYVNNRTKILCKCVVCEHTWSAEPGNLLRTNGTGCPKCNFSKGEKKIDEFLCTHDIANIPQKKFDDLVGIHGWKLSYDFYIPSFNVLIEYQGEQHYEPIKFGKTIEYGIKRLKTQQMNDSIKREYAKNNNMELLEIPYWEFDNIEEILESRLLKQSA